jgi:hypothetical protein
MNCNDLTLKLPFEIGRKLFYVSKGDVVPVYVFGYKYNRLGFTLDVVNNDEYGHYTLQFSMDEIGTLIFADVESALAELKRRNNDETYRKEEF